MDLGGLAIAALAGAAAMVPLAIYLGRGWRKEAREHRRALDERDLAEDAVTIAQGRVDDVTAERNAATTHLTEALATIVELRPLAAIGEKRRASWRKNDRVRDRKRVVAK